MFGLFQARFAKTHEFFAKVKSTVQRVEEGIDLPHRNGLDRKMQIVPETIRHRAGAASYSPVGAGRVQADAMLAQRKCESEPMGDSDSHRYLTQEISQFSRLVAEKQQRLTTGRS